MAFRQACREYATSQIALQKIVFYSLRHFSGLGKPLFNHGFFLSSRYCSILGKILDLGYLYQGAKPVHWCTQCGSSLAEAEVEYQNKVSPAIDVWFSRRQCPFFLESLFK